MGDYSRTYVRVLEYLAKSTTPVLDNRVSLYIDLRYENHGLTTRKPWTYDMKTIDLRHENHGLMTLTDFTLHFSCCFYKNTSLSIKSLTE